MKNKITDNFGWPDRARKGLSTICRGRTTTDDDVAASSSIVCAPFTQSHWLAFYGDTGSPETMTQACNSEEASSLVHPAEATWICEY